MASLERKDEIFCVRFRFRQQSYKRSLKTHDRSAAQAALNLIELTLHRLLTGQLAAPHDVDVGDFIVSGGTLTASVEAPAKPAPPPSLRQLTVQYLANVSSRMAPSYHASQSIHLRHLLRHLGEVADQPGDRIGLRELDGYLQSRLATRHANTAERERITLLQFFKWTVRLGFLPQSPATGLQPIKGGEDRPPFRTITEINRIIERGGISDAETLDLWDCLYLAPAEIGQLLAMVRENAESDHAYLLHAIPAYTGMRRGEVLRLRWVDVDLDEGYICARSLKQSRRKRETVRRIDLHPELKAELVAWRQRRARGQFVISEKHSLTMLTVDHANRAFWQPMRKTEWCLASKKNWFKIGFHTYRHSFASNMAAAGVDQRVIDEFMGHTTDAMRRRYRHLFPKQRRSAIESFSLVE